MNTKCTTVSTELSFLAEKLSQAASPEDVFGALSGTPAQQMAGLKRTYRQLAKVTHPDRHPGEPARSLAQSAFRTLTRWFEVAEERIQNGLGQARTTGSQTIVLRTPYREYTVERGYTADAVYNCYACQFAEHGHLTQAELKIVRQPQDNDLAQTEAAVLQSLLRGREAGEFSAYIPRLIETFLYESGSSPLQALVIERPQGWFSLEQVHQAYPSGIDPKDMAWMFRRILVGLGFAHTNHIIHAAVLPKNLFIHPEQHGLILTSWFAAVRDPQSTGARVKVLDPAYRAWYPPEILNKEPPLPGADLFMAARCMVYLLGGDPLTGSLPTCVPNPIHRFLKGCTLPAKRARPQDAWGLKEEFDGLIGRLWGERKFHPFAMR